MFTSNHMSKILLGLLTSLSMMPSLANCPPSVSLQTSLQIANFKVKRGEVSDQGVDVLSTKELSGTQDDWDSYIEISSGSRNSFLVEFCLDLQEEDTDEIYPDSIREVVITTNSIGLDHGLQECRWEVRNYSSGQWELLGDNANAQSWIWHETIFVLQKEDGFVDYFHRRNSRMKLRIRSNNDRDVVNLDYLNVNVRTGADIETSAPILTPTLSPTKKPTPSPTAGLTTPNPTPSPITKKPTPAPTDKPTPAPTSKPTLTPTERPITPAPTTKAVVTPSPTNKPTTTPTTMPVSPPSPTQSPIAPPTTPPVDASPPPQSGLWKPKASDGWTWQWQLQGTLDTTFDVDMYDVDLFDTSESTIQALHNDGRTVVCYFSAGTYEGWREDWKDYFPFLGGGDYSGDAKPFAGNMAEWEERWLDIREIDLLTNIMRSRLELAIAKGCDAVEPDNMDAYDNSVETGLDLTYEDQIQYNRWLADQAHDLGISIGLKNDVAQLADLVDYFDWGLNEECFEYSECDKYQDTFLEQDKAVFGVEYKGDVSNFCPVANARGMSWLKKSLSLQADRFGCEDYTSA